MDDQRTTAPDGSAEAMPADLVRALTGDRAALGRLVRDLEPVVRRQVGRVVARQARRDGRDGHELIEDLTQEVFLHLLDRGAHALKQWDPSRGRSLPSFVGLIASRYAIGVLRTRRHNPWSERPTTHNSLAAMTEDAHTPERSAVARQALAKVEQRAEARLTNLGRRIFRRLLVEQAPVAEVSDAEAMNPNAVYAWRNRLRRMLRGTPTWQ